MPRLRNIKPDFENTKENLILFDVSQNNILLSRKKGYVVIKPEYKSFRSIINKRIKAYKKKTGKVKINKIEKALLYKIPASQIKQVDTKTQQNRIKKIKDDEAFDGLDIKELGKFLKFILPSQLRKLIVSKNEEEEKEKYEEEERKAKMLRRSPISLGTFSYSELPGTIKSWDRWSDSNCILFSLDGFYENRFDLQYFFTIDSSCSMGDSPDSNGHTRTDFMRLMIEAKYPSYKLIGDNFEDWEIIPSHTT